MSRTTRQNPNSEKLSDSCDRELDCGRLRWAQNCDGEPFFDLFPTSFLRGKFQITDGSYPITSIDSRMGKDGWESEFFYINLYVSHSRYEQYQVLNL